MARALRSRVQELSGVHQTLSVCNAHLIGLPLPAGCFHNRELCSHYKELPLRLIILGMNPSDHAWKSGFSYSNPSNWFFHLLSFITGRKHGTDEINDIPGFHGIGFTDLGMVKGSDAREFTRKTIANFRDDLYERLEAHVSRVQATCAEHGIELTREQAEPSIVAFTGTTSAMTLGEEGPLVEAGE